MQFEKVLIVEGKSDRIRVGRILAEPIEIICTHGTISPYHLEELLAPYEQHEMYVFMDADEDGEKTRALFKREYPLAIHLYTEKVYKEVETTPYNILAAVLQAAHIEVRAEFL
jgi:toprim domain protein